MTYAVHRRSVIHLRKVVALRRSYIAAVVVGLVVAGAIARMITGESDGPPSATQVAGATPPLPARCSEAAPSRVPLNAWPATQRELAPPGAVAIRLCRYSGLNDKPRLRLTRAMLDNSPSVVGRLVGGFDSLPSLSHQIIHGCPADDASEIVAHLAYRDGRAVTISVGLRGCKLATNGSVNRTATGGAHPSTIVAQLEQLVLPPTTVRGPTGGH